MRTIESIKKIYFVYKAVTYFEFDYKFILIIYSVYEENKKILKQNDLLKNTSYAQ